MFIFQVIQSEYDFIIVGAGAAGAVIANRLTEVADWNVLLLEAGTDETIVSQIPALAAAVQLSNKDWQFKTEPQTSACNMSPDKRYGTFKITIRKWQPTCTVQELLLMFARRCLWPRGKMLGGSTSINYMLYVRGNKRDYDQWVLIMFVFNIFVFIILNSVVYIIH